MANPDARQPRNVAGRFFVDNQCIDCDVCREIAPGVFRQDQDAGYSYVWRQPTSEGDTAAAREAIDECPVTAIGEVE